MNWEYKFVFKDDRMADALLDFMLRLNELGCYTCHFKDELTNLDHYFDSPDLKLESQGMVCRARSTDKTKQCSLVLKRQGMGPNREVIYPQTEPINLGSDSLDALFRAEFPQNVKTMLQVFTGSERLEHVLTLRVKRSIIDLKDGHALVASLNLDRIEAMLPGNNEVRASDFEVELKSSLDNFPQADYLKDYLQNAFSLIPITRSKLRRMARLIRRHKQAPVRKVILDMDTGVDDALAILLAMNSSELDVLGVTAVGGNVDADQSARNASAVMSHLHSYVKNRYSALPPVAKGEYLRKGAIDASNVHGTDGLGGVCEKYLNTSIEILPNAKDLFQNIVSSHDPGTITLITTGPLTNVARWIEKCPETVKRLNEIISMGGVFFQAGNRSQAAEFNIHSDPASARKVVEFCRVPLSSGLREWHETLPLTFVGLDVTHQVRFRREVLESAMKKTSNDKHLQFIREITGHYMNFYYRNEGLNGCYLHDPLAVAYAIDPTLCQAEQYHVEVEDKGEFTAGMTVADYRPTRIFKDKMKEVSWIGYKVDSERFEKLFFARVLGI